MSNITLDIAGRKFTVACAEGEEAHIAMLGRTIDAKVADITAALVANSPNAVRESKRLVREVSGAAVNDALLADTAERIAAIRASDEGREGVQSFLGKRKPNWLLPA